MNLPLENPRPDSGLGGAIEDDMFDLRDDEQGRALIGHNGSQSSASQQVTLTDSFMSAPRRRSIVMKRAKDKLEDRGAGDTATILKNNGAVAVMPFQKPVPDPYSNDIWPHFRNSGKLPSRYYMLNQNSFTSGKQKTRQHLPSVPTTEDHFTASAPSSDIEMIDAPTGRPRWNLPVELVELIAGHLNRDDVKSLRLVSTELNRNVSQVLFKTVVVPFNMEIYGMLGQDPPTPDLKGKKKAKVETNGFAWKNVNGDDVYNGHGLDVFRGFGGHILRYGMSFEVNEDSLANPPEKSLTERHESFWGSYDWPFEEYCRFKDVAGLESAADETPRMKIAFSELSRVRELALSIDSGLGWLNGPDRSLRARILHKQPVVFGTHGRIPDRKTQAQNELWKYIEDRHEQSDSDIKLSTLYKMGGPHTFAGLKEAHVFPHRQPKLPFLDQHLIHEAKPHESIEAQIPISLEDPDTLDRFVQTASSPGAGVLFTSAMQPTDAGQLIGPIIPSNLTNAQREWLLETEWAQRAFLSSYMLSIIDNSMTFNMIHTLNISRFSDRYLSFLDRPDFWNSLPSLETVTLMIIPSWRTVIKDEAGFVDTPSLNPLSGFEPFHKLLKNIACRENITRLCFGWATGGEHAEGLHARNKLLFPAPLMRIDKVTEQNPAIVDEAMVSFPHVHQLTLRNCWLTPVALLQFVKKHDRLRLADLVLDSVSMTAMLRSHANGQNVNQQVAGNFPNMLGQLNQAFQALQAQQANAPASVPGQAQQNQNVTQLLNLQMQAFHLQMQQVQGHVTGQQQQQMATLYAQLQQHIQQNANGAQQQAQQQAQHQPFPAPALVDNAVASFTSRNALRKIPRLGSWMNVIDIITPGPNLSNFGSEHCQAELNRVTSLTSIEFISCGYAKLPHTGFDQFAVEPTTPVTRPAVLSRRHHALMPAMLNAKWPLLGEIVQEIESAELVALLAGWNLETGWQDKEAASAVEFDGLLPGGTGRFTGVVRASDRVPGYPAYP